MSSIRDYNYNSYVCIHADSRSSRDVLIFQTCQLSLRKISPLFWWPAYHSASPYSYTIIRQRRKDKTRKKKHVKKTHDFNINLAIKDHLDSHDLIVYIVDLNDYILLTRACKIDRASLRRAFMRNDGVMPGGGAMARAPRLNWGKSVELSFFFLFFSFFL